MRLNQLEWGNYLNQKNSNLTKKIVFRCDGAMLPEIGSGHVIRDIVIADKLVKQNICQPNDISFVMRRNGVFSLGENLVSKSGYHLENIEDKKLEWNTLAESKVLANLNPKVLIVDRLSTEADWMTYLASKLQCIVTMDDVGEGSFFADLAINSILFDLPNNDGRPQGYDYLVLKPIKQKPIPYRSDKVNLIVASFGGHDYRNLTGFFLGVVSKKEYNFKKNQLIDVLVGAESEILINEWKAQVDKISLQDGPKVRLIVRPDDFIERLARADLAVLSGGLTIFDAVSLGVPAIGLPQYQHQLATLQNLDKHGVLYLGSNGMDLDLGYFGEAYSNLLYAGSERFIASQRGSKLIDRKGTDRVISMISKFL